MDVLPKKKRKKRVKTEQVFNGEVSRAFRLLRPGCFWHKMNDQHGPKFTLKKPFDDIIITEQNNYAVECKAHKEISPRIPLSEFKDHQIETMKKLEKLRVTNFFLVNHRVGRGKDRINRAIIVYYGDVKSAIDSGVGHINLAFCSVNNGYMEKDVQYQDPETGKKERLWNLSIFC